MTFLYFPRFHWNLEWHEEDFPGKVFPSLSSSKQFGTRGDFLSKQVNEVSIFNLQNKVNDLTSLVRSLAFGNVNQVKVCSVCSL